jgi:hypothetical protein
MRLRDIAIAREADHKLLRRFAGAWQIAAARFTR